MNLQEKIQVIESDEYVFKKNVERVVEKYPFPIAVLVRGNKNGLSITIDRNFDKTSEQVFKRIPLGQS